MAVGTAKQNELQRNIVHVQRSPPFEEEEKYKCWTKHHGYASGHHGRIASPEQSA